MNGRVVVQHLKAARRAEFANGEHSPALDDRLQRDHSHGTACVVDAKPHETREKARSLREHAVQKSV
jgi:hypothetical protein